MKTTKETITEKPLAIKTDPEIQVEMPTEDRKRLVKFYPTAFDWQSQMLGEVSGTYVLGATTNDFDEKA